MRKEDIGMGAARLGREATPDALAEILAIRRFNMIIKSERVPGWRRPLFRRPRLTELGELVLLSAAEDALQKIGRLPVVDAEFDEVE